MMSKREKVSDGGETEPYCVAHKPAGDMSHSCDDLFAFISLPINISDSPF